MPARSERILRSKLAAPPELATHLARRRLIERLADASRRAGHRLLLMRAAAGFGKTTLMLQYLAHCRAAGRRTAWLSLDAADNDNARLIAHLAAAIGCVTEHIHGLIDALAAINKPVSIFLDEFEALRDPTALALIRQLLQDLPPNTELVMASRTLPAIGLGRLRANGQLHEIVPADLRFSIDETAILLRDQYGLSMADAEVSALYQRTEGWPAALHLAALSLDAHPDHANFVASFSGSHSDVAAYLTEDILSRLPESHRDFLLQTSVLSELSGPLCDAVTLRDDSETVLSQLDAAHLFVRPLDSQRSRFRHHRLFASFLAGILKRESPGSADVLRERAADWFLANDRPIPAIEHLLATSRPHRAIATIADHATDILRAGRVRMLVRWLDRFDSDGGKPATDPFAGYPRLRLAYALALAFNRRYVEATRIADEILATCEASEDPNAPSPLTALTAEAQLIRCQALLMTDRLEECFALSQRHIDQVPLDQPFQYGLMANIVAYCMICASRYDDARSVLSQAMQRHADTRMNFSRTVADGIESNIDLLQGRLGNALARLQSQTDRLWISPYGRVGGGKVALDVNRAMVLYESDRLDAAQRILLDNLPHSNDTGTPDALITTHVLLARIAWSSGRLDEARRHLADLESIGKRFSLPRVIGNAWLERGRIACQRDDRDGAAQALHQAQQLAWPPARFRPFANDVDDPDLLRVRWLLMAGPGSDEGRDNTAVEQAVGLLRDMLRETLDCFRYRRALKLRLLLAWALSSSDNPGEAEEADRQLAMAIGFAGREGFLRTFLEESSTLRAWLGRRCDAWRNGRLPDDVPARFIETLRNRLSLIEDRGAANGAGNSPHGVGTGAGVAGTRSHSIHLPPSSASGSVASVHPTPYPRGVPSTEADADGPLTTLTRREYDVLKLLADGLRNRMIAERLQLSETTVKTHLRNIHSKLDVGNRTEAIAVARQRGLV